MQFAERTNHWDDVYTFSDHARLLDPANDWVIYFYKTMADLHFKRYPQAVLDGRVAERLDNENQIPEIHLLLAEAYRATGDTGDEAIELQKFLESSPPPLRVGNSAKYSGRHARQPGEVVLPPQSDVNVQVCGHIAKTWQ